MMGYFIKFRMCVAAAACMLCITAPLAADDLRAALFGNTDKLMDEARSQSADVLSPRNFAAAEEAYGRAEEYIERGRADKATRELQEADSALSAALESTRLAKVTFRDTIKFRDLAIAADAPKYEPELWSDAERQFLTATRWLEAGNVKKGQSASVRALNDYATAELAAIKTSLLGPARALIAEAESNRVDRYAPTTLSAARALVAKVESDLDANRYATAEPRLLAADAEYEARHALYIAAQAEALSDNSITAEQLILEWEQPLQDVAAALQVTTDMSSGYTKAGDAALSKAQAVMSENTELSARVSELEIELGGTEMLVRETERLQRQLAQVEDLFRVSEARVVREGNDLILRLVGLSFPTGKAFIEPQYFELLTKVQDAVQIFPQSTIVIEGHTDAHGADNANLNLSQERADAVRQYLIATAGLPSSRVSAIGYGKSAPIASNDTDAGRAQNRRIDVVILDARARLNAQVSSRP